MFGGTLTLHCLNMFFVLLTLAFVMGASLDFLIPSSSDFDCSLVFLVGETEAVWES